VAESTSFYAGQNLDAADFYDISGLDGVHTPNLGAIEVSTIGRSLILDKDFSMVVEFDQGVFATNLSIAFKLAEGCGSSKVNLLLRKFNAVA
jgi:hypothetical protein